MRDESLRFRRSPHLVCYWAGGDMVIENYATRVRVAASPLASQILDFFDRWRTVEALGARLRLPGHGGLKQVVAMLARHSLLQRSDRPPHPREEAMEAWAPWNPAAGFFHLSTKDVPYAPEAGIESRLRRRVANRPVPPAFKRYPQAPRIRLPPPRVDGEFPAVLRSRRTWRSFSSAPIDLATLGTLLGLTWGVQRFMKVPALGRVPLRTSPSGGARHPIEVYVRALRVEGLPRGLYHYSADRHLLERLAGSATPRQVASDLPSQSWFASASALMLMTCVFPRVQWRYDSPRAYRAVLLEAGHFCQTFCLVATWLGLAPFCTLALADSLIEKDLGLDGVTESVLYAAGVGTRPAGLEWAPWPGRGPLRPRKRPRGVSFTLGSGERAE